MTEHTLTGVRGTFCAAHYSPEGEDHGHDYEAWAYFPAGPDARGFKARWQVLLDQFDHARLPEGLTWDNQLAAHLGHRAGAVRVRVIRPLQGIEAWWELGQ